MPYVYQQMPIGLVMSIIVYVCICLGRAYFKARGVKKDSVPDMINIELTNIPLKSRIIYITCLHNNPSLNRNIGKLNLNHIWDKVLLNTPGLKISPPQVYVHIHNNGHNQSIQTNGHLLVNIGHSGHALNSEHMLRGS